MLFAFRLAVSLLTDDVTKALCKCWLERATEERLVSLSVHLVCHLTKDGVILFEGACLMSVVINVML